MNTSDDRLTAARLNDHETGRGGDPYRQCRQRGAAFDSTDEFAAARGSIRVTMMGLPCLRHGGRFFAPYDRRTGSLVVKLDRHRVADLVNDGLGQPFAPAGRVFRE